MQAKSTTHPADRYCSNCRQMVQPQVGHSGLAWFLGVLIFGVAFAGIMAGGQILNIIVAATVVSGVVTVIAVPLTITRSCPICKSANLNEQAPVA